MTHLQYHLFIILHTRSSFSTRLRYNQANVAATLDSIPHPRDICFHKLQSLLLFLFLPTLKTPPRKRKPGHLRIIRHTIKQDADLILPFRHALKLHNLKAIIIAPALAHNPPRSQILNLEVEINSEDAAGGDVGEVASSNDFRRPSEDDFEVADGVGTEERWFEGGEHVIFVLGPASLGINVRFDVQVADRPSVTGSDIYGIATILQDLACDFDFEAAGAVADIVEARDIFPPCVTADFASGSAEQDGADCLWPVLHGRVELLQKDGGSGDGWGGEGGTVRLYDLKGGDCGTVGADLRQLAVPVSGCRIAEDRASCHVGGGIVVIANAESVVGFVIHVFVGDRGDIVRIAGEVVSGSLREERERSCGGVEVLQDIVGLHGTLYSITVRVPGLRDDRATLINGPSNGVNIGGIGSVE